MLVTGLSVHVVSGFRETLTNHTIASRLVSKSLGSYPLQQSRQLRLTAEYQPDRYNKQATGVPRARKKKEEGVKVLEAKLARKDEEIEELKTAIRSILAPLNELVKQRPKRKQPQNPDGEPESKRPHVTPSNNNSGHDNSQEDQTAYSPAGSTVTGYFHR